MDTGVSTKDATGKASARRLLDYLRYLCELKSRVTIYTNEISELITDIEFECLGPLGTKTSMSFLVSMACILQPMCISTLQVPSAYSVCAGGACINSVGPQCCFRKGLN